MFFEKGIYERPFTLERQQRTPTRNRIQNTPKVGSSDDWVQTNQRTGIATCCSLFQSASTAMQSYLLDPISFFGGEHDVFGVEGIAADLGFRSIVEDVVDDVDFAVIELHPTGIAGIAFR